MPEVNTIVFATYHLHYKEIAKMTKSAHNSIIFRLSYKLLLLLVVLSDDIIKIMKLLYNIKADIQQFDIYYLHYNNKIKINLTQTFICIASYLYFRYSFDSLGNLLVVFFIVYNSNTCAAELDIVTNKKKRQEFFLSV